MPCHIMRCFAFQGIFLGLLVRTQHDYIDIFNTFYRVNYLLCLLCTRGMGAAVRNVNSAVRTWHPAQGVGVVEIGGHPRVFVVVTSGLEEDLKEDYGLPVECETLVEYTE